MTDVIVVGSGASAVNAAWPLVEAGLRVRMLDVGNTDRVYALLIPDEPFSRIRRTSAEQHRFFLGDQFEGIPFGAVRVGAQLTPPRAFITRDTDTLLPVDAPGFYGMETLALGGLAAGWGAGVTRFTAEDLARTPISPADLAPHYRAVEERIGVCADAPDHDDLARDLGVHAAAMPALPPDTSTSLILERYRKRRERINAAGLRLGLAHLAVCTRSHRGRGPHRPHDMDFWSDAGRAVYRPRYTLDELRARENFEHIPGRLVLSFSERGTSAEVIARELQSGAEETHSARAVVLAAGVMGTARIVLRSLNQYDRPLPVVANPYTYVPSVNLGMLGREPADERHSLAQLMATVTPPGSPADPQAFISVYSYRSLLTFKLLKEAPLGARSALRLFRSLMPMITILGIHHADAPSPAKSMELRRDRAAAGGGGAGGGGVAGAGPDRLAIRYSLDDAETARIDRAERATLRAFRALNCYALKRVRPGHGSSIHYAGSLPMSASPRELQTHPDGLLAGCASVFIADGSTLPDLPAKGLTLTLMANADRIGTRLAERLA